ncbi:pyridoxal phosphate-dependent aminotransferase family protein [uncultured Clostridium sp.]|jgi:8-amino-7-oxononanoate synthase|uniref:aminotransferase class I/II-fold pyridoxal phosphate-dependent enzyme n=1 Tax=uncultured Clostridium sp. TaxID=59620 RepID=UPI0026131404|nr:pyridoxal phosphate-dependent aminotransferase family protein [uncultured Clostridium sp.]
MDDLKQKLESIKENNLLRKLKYLESPQEKNIIIEGKEMLLMASNNYLALANRKELKEEAIKGIELYGVGTGGSRLTTGSYNVHRELEEKLSKFFDREDTIVFNSGYTANITTLQAICDESYIIFSDELNHASIIDGCRLSKAKIVVFKHNNIEDLEKKLKENTAENKLIITEGVFSMSGDISPLDKIVKLAKKYNAKTMVDDAHGIGVVGEKGRGILSHFNINKEIDIYMGTLSKAIGTEGGFISGDKHIVEFLKNRARGFIYSTSIAASLCMASIKSLEIMESEDLNKSLRENIEYFNQKFKNLFEDLICESAIIKILIGDEKKAVEISNKLLEEGICIPAIRYPTVRKGEAILRVCLMSSHTKEDIDRVYGEIRKLNYQ